MILYDLPIGHIVFSDHGKFKYEPKTIAIILFYKHFKQRTENFPWFKYIHIILT